MSVNFWEGSKAERVASALETIAFTQSSDIDITDFEQIQKIVRAGFARKFFHIGDQIMTTYTVDSSHVYDMPWDVVDFGPATAPDGTTIQNAMWLQSHYVVENVPFSQNECFLYYFLSPGTYNYLYNGTYYQFTITQGSPQAFQFVQAYNGLERSYVDSITDINGSTWKTKIRIYSINSVTSHSQILSKIETVDITEGNEGTYIGEIPGNGVYTTNKTINKLPRILYGTNGYSDSNANVWLNNVGSDKSWWFDNVTVAYKTTSFPDAYPDGGFIDKIGSDFAAIISPVKIATVMQNINNSSPDGTYSTEYTNAKFFLPSIKQLNAYQYDDATFCNEEGTPFEYYLQLTNNTPMKTDTSYSSPFPFMKYNITDQTSIGKYWLRSPKKYSGNLSRRNVTSTSGNMISSTKVGQGGDYFYNGFAPVCVIY